MNSMLESYVKLIADHYIVGISTVISKTKRAEGIKKPILDNYKKEFTANALSRINTTFFKDVVDEIDMNCNGLERFQKESIRIIPCRVCGEMKRILMDIFRDIEHNYSVDIDYKKVVQVHTEIIGISAEYYRTIESAIVELRIPDVSLEDFMSDVA